jgi:crotonobetainyl-CoA:carnitine CoA-transferase CaiB-like acyl-CoA transferase
MALPLSPPGERVGEGATTEENPMGVLDGIKILELARVPPAEMPGMMLADMGADVLKIETPSDSQEDPDWQRRSAFVYVNRNKRSLALNMKAAEGQALFKKLAVGRRRDHRGLPPRA